MTDNYNELFAMVQRIAAEVEAAVQYELEIDDETIDLAEYFNDALDIEYTIGADRSFRGVCVAVALGGPNVFVDTNRQTVRGSWGFDHAECGLSRSTVDAIDELFEEYFNA